MSPPTTQIGPYRVRRQLGRGGMGVVYLAHDPRLERDVAIKVLAPELADDGDRLARFKHEARLLAQLNHPHIAQIYHLQDCAGRLHLVMEYVPGSSLAALIAREGRLAVETALSVGGQIADAMEAAHARGIVHRDLKPANVLVAPDDNVKIVDFGIARVVRTDEPAPAGSVVVGTPGYMAPEQIRGERVDPRADIFAFGCVLYEALAGTPAFKADTTETLLESALSADPDWDRLPTLPDGVARLVRDCLARRRDDRLPSIAEARRILDTALGIHATPLTPAAPPITVEHNLPRATTSFVGRVEPLRDLAAVLARGALDPGERVRLLTLTGSGGCGKTRLSIELARVVMPRFPDGVFLAELAQTSDPAAVPRVVAATLGVKDEPGRTTTETLCERLASRQGLLVLDNCEHVLEGAADLAASLLQAAPDLRVVATSREPLHLPGEHVWPVPPLSLPRADDPSTLAASEAVALFLDRARATDPGFALDDSNAGAVGRICRRLDGIPLAIELAAARVRMLSPLQIDERLDDRFRLLVTSTRGVPDRHRTLGAAVAWSYQALSESEKRLLRMLSVFVGGCPLESAVAVGGPGGDVEGGGDLDELGVLDLLTHLVEKSLAIAEGDGDRMRYRLLETVRQFAADRLEQEQETAAARDRHLDCHLALLAAAEPHFTGADQAQWLDRVEREHENVLAALGHGSAAGRRGERALRLCRSAMRFWLVRGHFKTGLEACAAALRSSPPGAAASLRAGALQAAAVMAQMLGDYDESRRHASEALALHRAARDPEGVARALNVLGNTAYYHGDLDAARRLHEEGLAINRRRRDERGVATSLNNLANVASDGGDLVRARELYREALAINVRIGNRASQAIILNNLGLMALYEGSPEESRRLHERSLAIRRDLQDAHGIAESLGHLGVVACRRDDPVTARRLHRDSLTMRQSLGDKLGLASSLDGVAVLASRLDETRRAARLLGACARLRDSIGAPRPAPDRVEIDECLDRLRRALGEAELAAVTEQGRSAPLDAAVADALEWLTDEAVDPGAVTRLVMGRPTPAR